MGLFQPITNTSHLPPVGANAENLSLDIKVKVGDSNYRELAKDVAAFANASGGVVLVGAAEDRKRGIVGKYVPMDQDEAKRVRDAFNQATRDLCSPTPVINPLIIECPGGFIVAINVWPFPGQAVGVQIEREPLGFAFPVRTGVETVWLTAEQLPMLMVPEIRRITILLDAIPPDARVAIVVGSGGTSEFTFGELRPLENVVVLQSVVGKKTKFHLPIDIISSVWKADDDGWRMIIRGAISWPYGEPRLAPQPSPPPKRPSHQMVRRRRSAPG